MECSASIPGKGSRNKRPFKIGNFDDPLEIATMPLNHHHVQHAREGSLQAIPDTFYADPYADPSSELAQRLQRIDAALDALLQHDPHAASYWVDRILTGWPSHRRDAVDVLETVAAVLCGHRGGLLQ